MTEKSLYELSHQRQVHAAIQRGIDGMEAGRTLPDRHPFATENPQFNYDLREKLVGLGNQRGYRDLFTIREQTAYVLAIHRAAQNIVHPDDLPSVPGE